MARQLAGERDSPEAWAALKRDLKAAYDSATEKFKNIDAWGDEIGDSMAIVVHIAYHLGAIRQLVKVIAEARR